MDREADGTCPQEITLDFVDAKLSIGCSRIIHHSGRHRSHIDSADVSIKDDWHTMEPSKPTTVYVSIEWEPYEWEPYEWEPR